ncbi:folylpolyglutamate synthase [Scheffersomyces xylosifermentans]|uniref:folylpolyglutamate synthase n=1 Tax=Scheffersomyces xylosifermentans TaxID=1304137 RepID=UPI00315D5626
MPIDLGLSRVYNLLKHLNNPHINAYKSIHIAGTNGKGSTIAYVSSILTKCKIKNGRFTSPHMLYYNDCICINNEVYPLSKFKKVNQLVQEQDRILQLGCTEFELLTVTAYKIFEIEQVEVAVIEVGLGGRLDATNVLEPFEKGKVKGGVIATGITKIGIDHESLLGNSLAAIASEKAGIIKRIVPVVVDGTNDEDVLNVVKKKAAELQAPVTFVDGLKESESEDQDSTVPNVKDLLELSPLKGQYQLQNLSIALKIIEIVKNQDHSFLNNENGSPKITSELIKDGVRDTVWQGRLQTVDIEELGLSIILDGAHNESAAIELGDYLQTIRKNHEGIIFVIAMTKGKSIGNLLRHITNRKTDTFIATTFSPPENMPWVASYDINSLQTDAKEYVEDIDDFEGGDINEVLKHVADKYKNNGDKRQVVVCGSLYLCGDVLRMVDNKRSSV